MWFTSWKKILEITAIFLPSFSHWHTPAPTCFGPYTKGLVSRIDALSSRLYLTAFSISIIHIFHFWQRQSKNNYRIGFGGRADRWEIVGCMTSFPWYLALRHGLIMHFGWDLMAWWWIGDRVIGRGMTPKHVVKWQGFQWLIWLGWG